jgi:starch phosphorylase
MPTDTYRKNDVLSVQESIVTHVEYTLARTRYQFDDFEAYQATAYSLRDRLIELWNDTQTFFKCVAVAWRGVGVA